MKICSNCNTENKEGNKFCVKCGSPFTGQKPLDKSVVINTSPADTNRQRAQQFNTQHQRVPQQSNIRNGIPPRQKMPRQPSRKVSEPLRPLRQPVLRETKSNSRSFLPIFFTILSLAIIVGAIIFYNRDFLFPPETEELAADTFKSEEVNEEEPASETTKAISPNDIIYLSGKIDGKYPVHMILDLNRREGVYYYDKYGPSNVISVSIDAMDKLNDGEWQLSITKHSDRYDNNEKWQGVLTRKNLTGTGEYLGKYLSFDLRVDEVSNNSTDPLIEKSLNTRSSSSNQWRSCEFTGYVTGGGQDFPIRITAYRNDRWEFKDAKYYNINYNVTIPVEIEFNSPYFFVKGHSGSTDLLIKTWKEGNEFSGTMTSNGNSLPITFTLIN